MPEVLAESGDEVAERFFGVPAFDYYALADGLRVLLGRTGWWRRRRAATPSSPQLWLFRFT
jgi:hypothetical protein